MVLRSGSKVIIPMLGGFFLDKVMKNYDTAINTQGPYNPNGKTRMDAVLATNHCNAGSVGFGVNGCIKMIYIGMRTFGEAEIGTVFCKDKVQKMLNSPSVWPAHQAVANKEVEYWRSVAKNPDNWDAYIGSMIATCFNPRSRIQIQLAMEQFRLKLLNPKQ